MDFRIGIDVGGTFTDFLVTREGFEPQIFKTLSTPNDPSIGLLNGLSSIATEAGVSLEELASSIDTIVHGTTVTTNAVLTRSGAKTALLTTKGVRDALEMRRGIREEQYNNRYENVIPLVPRHRRIGINERLDCMGKVHTPLDLEQVKKVIEDCKNDQIDSVAICFMNSFENSEHEKQVAELIRCELPNAYLSVSSDLLPSIRFYDRVSTTVLNSYVGPKLENYLNMLQSRLKEIGFKGALHIMQSGGGIISPKVAKEKAALTLLSGPAACPVAGSEYAKEHKTDNYITIDMGGTSFDAALVRNGSVEVKNDGEIDRHRIALPMLDIVTIGAGGGSIGRIDAGGLLRMGPESAGSHPGPVCYDMGGELPTSTDADLVLGYLDPEYFAGGKIKLNLEKARDAIEKHIAKPLNINVEKAAAGMYRIVNTNMAQGVREITIKRGSDPREFLTIVAGGAGPIHSCAICRELEISKFLVPRESSIFCAAGMLMSNLQHDFVHSLISDLAKIDLNRLRSVIEGMIEKSDRLLEDEGIPKDKRQFDLKLDCRYIKQFHEVSYSVPIELVKEGDLGRIISAFHHEHLNMYGYSLEKEKTPVELINVRIRAVGITQKPQYTPDDYHGEDPGEALKNYRDIYVPEKEQFENIAVYDGHKLHYGNCIQGPALIEQKNTTLFVSASFDCICDRYGSFVVYQKGKEEKI